MTITCRRCGRTTEPLPQAPLPGELGAKILQATCPDCWQEWLKTQVILINEYRLSLADPQTRHILTEQMKAFLQLSP